MGTGKKMKEINMREKGEQRMVTFSKRRHGLFKKAHELPCLTGAHVASVILSGRLPLRPRRPLSFDANIDPSFDATIDPSFDATIDPSLSGVRVSRKSNRFAWVRNSGGSEMVRPSENWERLVRATLRREKLRHDGRGGHERAPIGIAGSVPPSLTRETNIDLILPAAYEIQPEDPNVARIRK
ncbi:hypothetical protein RHGRI_017453 [Rhododendron griersonianum]|uniref:MADS-box domain-containing protein n=1 Tax=Rhododendron griersonianum TaxID=479676 RepID=A0AAV6JXV5_9ERIC|nr:hypothetical protein RHGRI_017453 [Rhododendron griersonianum]